MKGNISLLSFSILALSLFLGGCAIRTNSTYVLNPDMSGKCVFEERMGIDLAEVVSAVGDQDPKKLYSGLDSYYSDTIKRTQHDVLLAFANKILNSKGIETWSDVKFGMIGHDTVYFKGTAYFKDITAINLSSADTMMEVTQTANGETVLRIKEQKNSTTRSYDSTMKAALAAEKKYMPSGGIWSAMMHCYMATMFRDMDIRISYQVPGKITDYSYFEKKNDNTVVLDMSDKRIMSIMDSTLGSNSSAMSWFSRDPSSYNNFLYGQQNKPLQVTFKADSKPIFDYTKEVADAKKYYAAFRKTSGIAVFDSVQKAIEKQKEEEAMKEHGTLVVTADDSANNKVYFKKLGAQQYFGMLSFSGEFSKPIISNSYSAKIIITKAYDDKGNNYLDSISGHDGISAYASPMDYSSYSDSVQKLGKVTFNITPNLPADCKILNLEGTLILDDNTTLHFKIKNLYLKPHDSGYGGGIEEDK